MADPTPVQLKKLIDAAHKEILVLQELAQNHEKRLVAIEAVLRALKS